MISLTKNIFRIILNKSKFRKNLKKRPRQRNSIQGVLNHIKENGFQPVTVIDVGVAYGTFDLYDSFPDVKHILIEPLKEYETVLKKISENYNADYIIAAAGSKNGKLILNVHPDLSGSSSMKECEGSHVDGIEREIPVVTIDNVCKEKKLKGPYLLKVDVQGAEIEVMEGTFRIVNDLEVVILEVSLFQFFIECPQFFDVMNYMNARGFCVYDVFGEKYRPFDGALGQLDLIFVKKNGQFRKSHFWATQEQRKLLLKNRIRSLNPDSFK